VEKIPASINCAAAGECKVSISRSKAVELKGLSFELRRLLPEVGSFIFMRMMGMNMRMAQENAERAAPKSEQQSTEDAMPAEPISGELRVRALAFSVFAGGIAFDDFKFIQSACLKSVSRKNDAGLYMPIMSDGGVWTGDGKEVRDDVGLVMQLTTEVLIFCFADFFEETSPGT
jgi:hypothetical protein